MRQQLAEARATAERNQAQLADAHTYVQSILANLSAGVLAFDELLRLRSFNHSASAILDLDGTCWSHPVPQSGEIHSISHGRWAQTRTISSRPAFMPSTS